MIVFLVACELKNLKSIEKAVCLEEKILTVNNQLSSFWNL